MGKLTLDDVNNVFFYEQEFYVLSNFSAFKMAWKGKIFGTSEEVYHWEKFDHPDGLEIQVAIENCMSAHEAFKIAEANKGLRLSNWDDIKLSVMSRILFAKADSHEYVRRKLLETGDRMLIENSWRDSYWGWGEDRKGENHLGRLWMEIRNVLRGEA